MKNTSNLFNYDWTKYIFNQIGLCDHMQQSNEIRRIRLSQQPRWISLISENEQTPMVMNMNIFKAKTIITSLNYATENHLSENLIIRYGRCSWIEWMWKIPLWEIWMIWRHSLSKRPSWTRCLFRTPNESFEMDQVQTGRNRTRKMVME